MLSPLVLVSALCFPASWARIECLSYAVLLTVANGTDPINFASMMSSSAPAANATTPSYNGTALWFSQTAGKLGACLVQSTCVFFGLHHIRRVFAHA